MDLHPALAELAAQHKLSGEATRRLYAIAGLDREPTNLRQIIPLGIGVLGAALLGLGIIFWIAANWDSLSRLGRFTLLQTVVVIMCAGALWRPRARLALGLLACLAIGGLFAYFGQTYQTGADPWQLFALWAALALPLCLGVRHDGLWLLWTVVAMTGITLWTHANSGPSEIVSSADMAVHLTSWGIAIIITTAFTPPFRAYLGAGNWSLRLALTMTVLMIGAAGLFALFARNAPEPIYWLALMIYGAASLLFAVRRLHDTFCLSALGLGLNVLLVGGLVRVLFQGTGDNWFFPLLFTGCAAAGLLAFTVKVILKLSRAYDERGGV